MFLYPVEFRESSLGKTPEILNPIDMYAIAFRKLMLFVIDPVVLVIPHIDKPIVSPPFVRVNHGRRINSPSDNGLQSDFLAVGNYFSVHPSVALHNAEDRLLHRAATSLQRTPESSCTLRAEVAFIHLSFTKYLLCLLHLMGIDRLAKLIEILIDRVAIDAHQNGRF